MSSQLLYQVFRVHGYTLVKTEAEEHRVLLHVDMLHYSQPLPVEDAKAQGMEWDPAASGSLRMAGDLAAGGRSPAGAVRVARRQAP